MDRAYDSQRGQYLVKESIPKTERLPRNKLLHREATSNKNCSRDKNDSQKTISTHPLDEAMQELLDICKQYDDKLKTKRLETGGHQPTATGQPIPIPITMPAIIGNNNSKTICDTKMERTEQAVPSSRDLQHAQQSGSSTNTTSSDPRTASESIQRLQEKQTELQLQLDEFLLVSKRLASKKKHHQLTDIIEDQEDLEVLNIIKGDQGKDNIGADHEDEDDDDELIEFQQIENELRISDLKRQLDNVQEELRIRLFKRLVSNTGVKQVSRNLNHQHHLTSANSMTNESSPSSSSCSETPSSSMSNNGVYASSNGSSRSTANTNAESDQTNHHHQHPIDVTDGSASRTGEKTDSARSQDIIYGATVANNEFHSISYKQSHDNIQTPPINLQHTENNNSDHDSAVDYTEALTPTTSKESVASRRKDLSADLAAGHSLSGLEKDTIAGPYQAMSPFVHNASPLHPSSHRNNSANSDLERIEENDDEEDEEQDYYCSSDKFRTIYEEKLSPIIQGHAGGGAQTRQLKAVDNSVCGLPEQTEIDLAQQHQKQNNLPSMHDSYTYRQNNGTDLPRNDKNAYDSTKQLSNGAMDRPLTLYLPKPDEEIDLAEHVQALGHDVSIISDDVKLSSKTSQGYLWKCCLKNTNKWLRRYFYFDREARVVSYFKSESELVKKNPLPRNSIPFEEITDVYVDHKLSGLEGRGSSSKNGRNYVFVLATIGRKYLLASSKAETMRAWIDILFTAAKANDYFEQLASLEDGTDLE